jgi:hypothetical protein
MIFKNSDEILVDPQVFSKTTIAIFGIEPDFEEIEPLTSEMINVMLELLIMISSENEMSFTQMSEEVQGFISICCLEEGLWFLENRLKSIQDKLLEISEVAYSKIPDKDLKTCKDLWDKYQKSSLTKIPSNDELSQQVFTNKVIKDYTNLLLSNQHVDTSTLSEGNVPIKKKNV